MASFYDRLLDLTKIFTRIRNKNKVYDTTKKQLDLSKVLDPEDLFRVISDISGGSSYGSNIFNKFFDLSIGRNDRYSQYKQIYYRIPEVASALHIYVDLLLSPNIGDKNNQLRYIHKGGPVGKRAEEYSKALLESSSVINYLPKIMFNFIFYGDCFVSHRKTNFGIQYTIHDTEESSILFDKSTNINLGLVVKVPRSFDSPLDKVLSLACPSISLDLPRRTVGIIADKKRGRTVNDYEYQNKVKEIEDLISEILINTNDNTQVEFKYFPPGKYTQFSLYYNNFYYPYGTAILDPLMSTAKQLLLTEAALSIYRMTRAPLRYKFMVEVGTIPEKNIRGMLNAIKDSIKKDRVISDSPGESIDSIPDIIAPEEDFWIPVVNGTPWFDISNIEGGRLDQFTGDVEYFKKKLIGGIGLPPSYVGQEEGTSTRALLTLEDMRLNRTIKKYQRDFNVGLTDLNDDNLMIAGVPELVGAVEVQLPPPQTLEDNVRIDNIEGRLSTASNFNQLFPNVPKLWIMKNIVCIDQNEIDDMEKMIEDQKKYNIFAENKPGEIGPDGQSMDAGLGGMGGLGGFGTSGLDDFGGGGTDDFEGIGAEMPYDTGNEDLENIDFNQAMDDVGSDIAQGPGEGEIQL